MMNSKINRSGEGKADDPGAQNYSTTPILHEIDYDYDDENEHDAEAQKPLPRFQGRGGDRLGLVAVG